MNSYSLNKSKNTISKVFRYLCLSKTIVKLLKTQINVITKPRLIMKLPPHELEVQSLYHLYSLKTKRPQCHYVMTLCAFGFEAKEVINKHRTSRSCVSTHNGSSNKQRIKKNLSTLVRLTSDDHLFFPAYRGMCLHCLGCFPCCLDRPVNAICPKQRQ